ncbi:MAG TPA: chemotaxis-specific protein-glutamate methyltransferase CheB [Patescibacteria group bacterium]|nr:chemotaxis-specific protein-glutamate methyltransferase CheB [Patescibacteria group bacterium]
MRQASLATAPIRVLIVDDSKVVRAVIGKILQEAETPIRIVGYAEDGASALRALDVCDPDIVILDLAMPSMDGLTALPLILRKKPHARIVVCSALSSPGAEISVRALSLGATACVPKPMGSKNTKAIAEFKEALTQAVVGLYETGGAPVSEAFTLRPGGLAGFRPRLVAVGSSTGGPNALMTLFRDLGPVPVPVIVTQHMIEMFTTILARQLQQETGIECHEARQDMELQGGRIYIAPGGSHMMLKRAGSRVTIAIDNGPAENFCKPSVDVMLRSTAAVYGAEVMAVILTGMGKDGLRGCEAVTGAGGRVIAQDQESSVVWGMPGSVARAGLASAVMPLPGLARLIRNSVGEGPPSPGER